MAGRMGDRVITISGTKYTIYRDDWGMWTLARPNRGGAIGCGTFEQCVARMVRELSFYRREQREARPAAVAKRRRVA